MAGGGIKVNNINLSGGADGATFVPSIDKDGFLSWSNNKGYTNPATVKVRGEDGATGAKLVSQVLKGQDANGGNIYEQTFDDGTKATFIAPKGEDGKQGPKGDVGGTAPVVQETGQSTTDVMSQKAVTDAINNAITTALNTEV